MQDFHRVHPQNRSRMERVEQALRKWEEWEIVQQLPAANRPVTHPPTLSRAELQSLRQMLLEVLSEQEWQWERRN